MYTIIARIILSIAHLHVGTMVLVRLPDALNDADWKTEAVKKDLIVDTLYFKHKIEVCYHSTTLLRSRGRF